MNDEQMLQFGSSDRLFHSRVAELHSEFARMAEETLRTWSDRAQLQRGYEQVRTWLIDPAIDLAVYDAVETLER